MTPENLPEDIQVPANQPCSLEIERKWIARSLPDLSKIKPKEIIQGYIAISPDGTEVRLRQKETKYFLTVKSEGNLSRREYEIEVTKEQFKALWYTAAGRHIEKDRYEIPYGDFVIELDVYKDGLSGLVVAEVEFCDVNKLNEFVVPEWFGDEVTMDKRYKNKTLAVQGLPKQS